VIHPPSFSEGYKNWWANRALGENSDAIFTCLLMRICACSTQFPNPALRQMLESDLGENIKQSSNRYHLAARSLSYSIRPGKGGLMQVQQLLLTASWLKADARFVESWHVLASAIHEAQELGLHNKQVSQAGSQFEDEMRKRVWCVLYVWDW
jgi:hypothetical protein